MRKNNMGDIYFNYQRNFENDYGGYYEVSNENGFLENIDPSELGTTRRKYRVKGFRTLIKSNENRITVSEIYAAFEKEISFAKNIPEVVDWAAKCYQDFYDSGISDLELIKLVLNHLKHVIKTAEFFEELKKFSYEEDRKRLLKTAACKLKEYYQSCYFKVSKNSDIVEKYLTDHMSIVEFLEQI